MTIKKLIEDKITDKKIQLIIIILCTGISIVFSNWRSAEAKGDEFYITQLTNCEKNYQACLADRFNDFYKWDRRLDSLVSRLAASEYENNRLLKIVNYGK